MPVWVPQSHGVGEQAPNGWTCSAPPLASMTSLTKWFDVGLFQVPIRPGLISATCGAAAGELSATLCGPCAANALPAARAVRARAAPVVLRARVRSVMSLLL